MIRFICELPESVQKAIENRAREFYKNCDCSYFDDVTNCLDDIVQNIMNEKIVNVWYAHDDTEVLNGSVFPLDDLIPYDSFY